MELTYQTTSLDDVLDRPHSSLVYASRLQDTPCIPKVNYLSVVALLHRKRP